MLPQKHLSLFTLALVLATAGLACADGFIIVHPPRPGVQVVPLAVKNHNVTVDIQGQVAVTTVDQVFHNPNPMQLEGTYIFPIPEDAGIENLSLWIDGIEQKAELLDRDKARGIYEGIVRQMKDPALLEYVGRKAFKLRVFPLPPRGDRRVKLSYRELVPADGGLARYLYPLNTEKFSSRPLENVTVDVKISSPKPLGNVLVLSHKAEIIRSDDHHARVTYEARNVTPDRDFVVHFAATTKEFGLDVVAHNTDGGYALVALSPRQELDPAMRQPKDVVFVFDTSGSMHGKRFEQATGALRFCVDTLRDGDRFELINYATEARSLFGSLREVSADSRQQALTHIDKLEPLGGTNIDEALERAQSLNPKGDRPFMVLFLTDGLPTIGATVDVDEILKHAAGRRADNQRIFAFGVGNDVNTDLLDRLAEENRGTRTYVGEREDIEIAVGNLWKKIASPVLTNLSLTTSGGARLVESYPRKLPDLFHGVQLLVTTRYEGTGPTAITLTGQVAGETRKYVYECTFPEAEAKSDYLPRLWAVRKVGYLLDEIHIHGENKELVDEVVRLSKKFGIMTPYTSYLVVEDQPIASTGRRSRLVEELAREDDFGGGPGGGGRGGGFNLGGAFSRPESELRDRRNSSPAEGASGDPGAPPAARPLDLAEMDDEDAEALDGFLHSRGELRKSLQAEAGALSVKASRLIERLKQADQSAGNAGSFAGEVTGTVKHVAGRTFYRQGNGWVQAEAYDLKGDPTIVKLQAFSDDYFALLSTHPELARVLALGSSIVFLTDDKVYVITS